MSKKSGKLKKDSKNWYVPISQEKKIPDPTYCQNRLISRSIEGWGMLFANTRSKTCHDDRKPRKLNDIDLGIYTKLY